MEEFKIPMPPSESGADSSDQKTADPSAPSPMSLDSDMPADRKLTLVSKDQQNFEVKLSHACISTLIKTSLETDKTAESVPIPGVKSDVMVEILKYMDYHKGTEPPIIDKPLRSKVMKDVCKTQFDADFIDAIGENRQLLYDLILAANYLDIKSLLHLGCAKVASLIKGQPLEKIKEILSKGIKDAGESKDSAPASSSSGSSAAAPMDCKESKECCKESGACGKP